MGFKFNDTHLVRERLIQKHKTITNAVEASANKIYWTSGKGEMIKGISAPALSKWLSPKHTGGYEQTGWFILKLAGVKPDEWYKWLVETDDERTASNSTEITQTKDRFHLQWRGAIDAENVLLSKADNYWKRSAQEKQYPIESDIDHWVRVLPTNNAPRMLAIVGPSGRGKTAWAVSLMQALRSEHPASPHFFLGCMYSDVDRETLASLLDRDPQIEQSGLPAGLRSGGTLPYTEGLYAADATPIYIWLDDADRRIEDIAVSESPIRRLLERFKSNSSVRFIFTARDPQFVTLLTKYIYGDNGTAIAVAGNHKGKLPLLNSAHVKEILKSTASDLIKPELTDDVIDLLFIQHVNSKKEVDEEGVSPLNLTVLLEVLRDPKHGDRDVLIKGMIEEHKEHLNDAPKKKTYLRDQLFRERLKFTPDEVKVICLALAVLSDPAYEYTAAVTEDALQAVSGFTGSSFENAMRGLRPGGHSTFAVVAGNELVNCSVEGDIRFSLDPIRDHFYNESGVVLTPDEMPGLRKKYARLLSNGNHELPLEHLADFEFLKMVMHYRAAQYYDARDDANKEHATADDAAWHYLRVGDLESADELIDMASAEDEVHNLYARASRLRKEICTVIAGKDKDIPTEAPGETSIAEVGSWPRPDSNCDSEKVAIWAKNAAEWAYCLYCQGWAISYGLAYRCAQAVIETYFDVAPGADAGEGEHANEYAKLIAEMVAASVDFELAGDESLRSIPEVTRIIQACLQKLKSTEDGARQEMIETNGYTLLGILYNRMGRFEEALDSYNTSAKRWIQHSQQIEKSRRLNLLDPFRTEYSAARTLILLGRAEEGLNRVAPFFGSKSKYKKSDYPELFADSQDRAFGLVALCQCALALNMMGQLDCNKRGAYLYQCFSDSDARCRIGEVKRPAILSDRAKCVEEAWIECYIDALTGTYKFYQGDFWSAEVIFRYCAEKFSADGETRDARMMEVNAAQAMLFARIRSGQTTLIGPAMSELIRTAIRVVDEPIILKSVTHTIMRLASDAVQGGTRAFLLWQDMLRRLLLAEEEIDLPQQKFTACLKPFFNEDFSYTSIQSEFEDRYNWTERCFGKLINNDPKWEKRADRLLWLPVISMRGPLLLKPKPITSVINLSWISNSTD